MRKIFKDFLEDLPTAGILLLIAVTVGVLLLPVHKAITGVKESSQVSYASYDDDNDAQGHAYNNYQDAYDAGFADGRESGWEDGYEAGRENPDFDEAAYDTGWQDGYLEGYKAAQAGLDLFDTVEADE